MELPSKEVQLPGFNTPMGPTFTTIICYLQAFGGLINNADEALKEYKNHYDRCYSELNEGLSPDQIVTKSRNFSYDLEEGVRKIYGIINNLFYNYLPIVEPLEKDREEIKKLIEEHKKIVSMWNPIKLGISDGFYNPLTKELNELIEKCIKLICGRIIYG